MSKQYEYTERRNRVMDYITRPGMPPPPWSNDFIKAIAIACQCSADYVKGLAWRLQHPERVRELSVRSNIKRRARLRRKRLKEAQQIAAVQAQQIAAWQAQELATAGLLPTQQLEMAFEAPAPVEMLPEPPAVIHVTPDMVNHPPHYTDGGIETIDYIKAKLSREEYIGYLRGNILKYTSRLGKKDNITQEVGKIGWYTRELADFLGSK